MHEQVHRDAFAMEQGPVGLQKVAIAAGTVQLTPGTTAGMAIRAEVPSPQPSTIITAGIGTEVHRGVDLTWAALGHDDRGGWHWRGWLGMRRLMLTQNTRGLVRQTSKRCGLLGALTPRLDGLDWRSLYRSALAG